LSESKYEKYITRKAAVLSRIGSDGVVRFEVPKTPDIPLKDKKNTGPRMIFSNDVVKEATTKIEYGFILSDTVLLNNSPNYGAHKHDYPEIFLFLGSDPNNTNYLGAEGEFWLGEGNDLEKIILNTSCSVYIPPNLGHFPLFFRNIKTPVIMGVVIPKVGDLIPLNIPRPRVT
jgi:hypothetical protein